MAGRPPRRRAATDREDAAMLLWRNLSPATIAACFDHILVKRKKEEAERAAGLPQSAADVEADRRRRVERAPSETPSRS